MFAAAACKHVFAAGWLKAWVRAQIKEPRRPAEGAGNKGAMVNEPEGLNRDSALVDALIKAGVK